MPDPERRTSARRFVLETAAVLSGILIAFGLDAGWGTLRDRSELRESLSLLREEFATARVQMDTVLAVNGRAIEATSILLELTPSGALALSADEVQYLWVPLQRSDSFDPGESAINAVVSSNIFERMDDPELRRLVSGWTGRLSDLREEEREAARVEGRTRDLLAQRGLWWPRLEESFSPQGQIAEWIKIEEVRQLFSQRQRAVFLILREQEPLSHSLDRILELLDSELGDS